MSKYKVINVPYGVASVYNNGTIEINQKLKGKLRQRILNHEKSHGLGRYSKEDWKIDFQAKNSSFSKTFKFALRNPEMLIGFCLIMWSYYFQKPTFNSSALYPFGYFGIIWTLFFFVIFKINPILAILAWFYLCLGINVALLIYTHLYTKSRFCIIQLRQVKSSKV